MAVAVDSNPATFQQKVGSSVTYTGLTIGAALSNSAAVFMVTVSAQSTISTMTWNGVSCTKIIGANTSGAAGRAELWGIVNPASGNQTLSITLSASDTVAIAGVSFSGVDQTGGVTTFPNSASLQTTGTNPSLSVTSATGNFTAGALTTNSASISSTTQTQVYVDTGFPNGSGAASIATGAASVAHGYVVGSTTDPEIIVVTDIKAAGGADVLASMIWL